MGRRKMRRTIWGYSQFHSGSVLFRISRNSSHVALCHMTQLTNRNCRTTMAVMKDAQLSKDFDGFCLAKGILIFTLSPAVIHSIAFSVVLSIYFLHRKQMEYKISIHHLFVYFCGCACIRNFMANSGSRDSNDVTQLQNVINKHRRKEDDRR